MFKHPHVLYIYVYSDLGERLEEEIIRGREIEETQEKYIKIFVTDKKVNITIIRCYIIAKGIYVLMYCNK